MSTIPGVRYGLDAAIAQWVAPGRDPLPAVVQTAREDLVAGTYIPGLTPDTVGVRAGTDLVDVEADASGRCMLPAGTYTGKRFWGYVRPSGPGVVILRDCALAGMDPRLYTTNAVGAVHNVDYDDRWVELYDCTLDGFLWADVRGVRVTITMTSTGTTFEAKTSPFSNGYRGRNIKMRRCEVSNFQDLGNGLGNNLDLEQNAMHSGWYAKGGVGTSADGQTHTDCVQMAYGQHWNIRFNYLGGPRNADGYDGAAPGFNAGTDCANSIFMLQQDVAATTGSAKWVDDIVITDNWLAGGSATVNSNFKNGNDLAGVTIARNRFLRSGTLTPVRNDAGAAYIYTKTTLAMNIGTGADRNVLWDWDGPITGSGETVPIRVVAG